MFGWIELKFATNVTTADQERRLRSAWSALRLRHPDVALTLHDDEKRYEPLQSDADLSKWTSETFYVEKEARCVDELIPRLKLSPSKHASCHWFPTSKEILIVSPHWRWDGKGIVMLLSALVELSSLDSTRLASLPQPGAEAVNLVPSLNSLLDITSETVIEKKWCEKADQMLASFVDGTPALGMASKDASLPQDTKRIVTKLSNETMATVLEACRSRGIRFTAALHASIAKIVYDEQSATLGSRYKSWAAFDLRKYCPTPANSSGHAPSLRMMALPMVAEPKLPWDELASIMQSVYDEPMEVGSDAMSVRVPYVERATKVLAHMPVTTEPNLSNLGKLDDLVKKNYGDIGVRGLSLAVQMLSPQLYVHSWGWDGETQISVCYNEAFYDGNSVRGWLERVKISLLENLGVNTN